MSGDTNPSVAVVDDDTQVLKLYEAWLQDEYDVRTANGGPQALEAIDEAVAVVLLDRRMPELDGDTVLEQLRDRGFDGMVAMITAVDPDEDIAEMPFDDYVTKPLEREELVGTVESLLGRQAYTDLTRQVFRLASKLSVMEDAFPESELDDSEAYQQLQAELDQAKNDADQSIQEMVARDEMVQAYSDL